MAFPVVQATSVGNGGSSRTTSTTVNLPADIVAGNLLVILFACETAAAGPTTPTGWTLLFARVTNVQAGMSVFTRVADGAEGASVAVAHGSNFTAYNAYRIDDCPGIIEAGTAVTGASANPDPPSFAPSWGLNDTLWLAIEVNNGNEALTVYPASYTDGITDRSTNGSGNDNRAGSARRDLAAASDDPGTFTLGASRNWIANTLAIKPYEIRASASVTEEADTLTASATPDPVWEIIIAQMAGATVRIAPLVRFGFLSGEKRLWPGFGEVTIDSEVWEGIGGLGKISEVSAGPSLSVEEMTFQLFASAEALVGFTADADESAGREVNVYLQFFDLRKQDETGVWVEWQPLGAPISIFWGIMGPLAAERLIPDSDSEAARAIRIMTMSAANALVNRARPPFTFYSERDQRARHPGDNIFARVSDAAIAKVRWPKL